MQFKLENSNGRDVVKRTSPWVWIALLACAMGVVGCDTRHQPVPAPTTAATNESSAAAAAGGVIAAVPKNLPLIGTYSGMLPCSDCAGIRMQLTLLGKRGVSAYRLHEIYVGTPDGDKKVDAEGKAATVSGYEANPNATVYALNPDDAEHARYFLRVDDMHLRMLNSSKQEITSRSNLTLTRDPPPEPSPTPTPVAVTPPSDSPPS